MSAPLNLDALDALELRSQILRVHGFAEYLAIGIELDSQSAALGNMLDDEMVTRFGNEAASDLAQFQSVRALANLFRQAFGALDVRTRYVLELAKTHLAVLNAHSLVGLDPAETNLTTDDY